MEDTLLIDIAGSPREVEMTDEELGLVADKLSELITGSFEMVDTIEDRALDDVVCMAGIDED